MLINRLNHTSMILDIPFVGLKIYIFLEEVGILHSARMEICIFEPFPAKGNVGVNQKIFIKYELLLKDNNYVIFIF